MSGLRDETIRLLADLIRFPTVSESSNLDLIAWIADRLAPTGADVTLTHDSDRRKANLFATIGPRVDGGVVLSGHTDVVPARDGAWRSPPFEASRRNGRIYGRGACDMKGFLACALAMAPRFASASSRAPVHLAFTFGEEIGCRGAPLLLEELAASGPRPAVAIVGEPTSMRIVHAHKGCHEFTTTFTGREGHGSAPANGVNAVEYASRYVERLLALRAELAERCPPASPFEPPETTLNVGTIAGGSARNVVAGCCTVEWELRPVSDADARHALESVRAFERELEARMREEHADTSIVTITEGAVDGLEAQDDSPAVELVRRLLPDAAAPQVVPYSTEAGLYQRAGIPAVVCGPGSIEVAHRPDEHVTIEQLDRCVDMLGRLVRELS